MVSTPSYDPNLLSVARHRPRSGPPTTGSATEPAEPLLNRALRQTYPPGSTFKVVTAAAALATGRYSPDTQVARPRELDLPLTDATLPNFDGAPCSPAGQRHAHRRAQAARATPRSASSGSTSATTRCASRPSSSASTQALEVPMRSVAQRASPRTSNAPQTAQSAIGQFDVRATPLQMAMVAAAVANDGVLMTPYLVDEVLAPDLDACSRRDPAARAAARPVSPQTAATLTADDGRRSSTTAPAPTPRSRASRSPARPAPRSRREGRAPHAWFVVASPRPTDPQVAVAVVVEDGGEAAPRSPADALAAPIAQAVMEAVLGR